MYKVAAPLMFLVMFCSLAGNLPAAVTVPSMIGSHMVLQRDMPVPVWGDADPNERIMVKFRDQQKIATADAHGKWMVKLDPLGIGGPAPLTVTGSNTITLVDVNVGEVWLGSGQSNLDSPVNRYVANDPLLKEAASKKYPRLRLLHVSNGIPQGNTGWEGAGSGNLGGLALVMSRWRWGRSMASRSNTMGPSINPSKSRAAKSAFPIPMWAEG